MAFKCPKCNSSLFHIEKAGSEITIQCYRSKECGWSMKAEEVSD